MSSDVKYYNYRLSRARIVVENAFGRLKARWRQLLKQNDMSIENVPMVVTTCCILHNMCEKQGDAFDSDWLSDIDISNKGTNELQQAIQDNDSKNTFSNIRNALIKYFIENPL